MDKHQQIKKVVLKPIVPNPRFEVITEYEHPNYFPYDALAPERLVRDEFIFQQSDWRMEWKVGPTEKFQKVAEIVGEDKAAEVLALLDG